MGLALYEPQGKLVVRETFTFLTPEQKIGTEAEIVNKAEKGARYKLEYKLDSYWGMERGERLRLKRWKCKIFFQKEKCRLMWGDVGFAGIEFAKMNPLRWNSWKSYAESVDELISERGKDRPIVLQMRTGSDKNEVFDKSVGDAVAHLVEEGGELKLQCKKRETEE